MDKMGEMTGEWILRDFPERKTHTIGGAEE
jgi:hypothetical protein